MRKVTVIRAEGPHARTRAYRRVSPPVWPFGIGGLFPILGLSGLFLFGLTRFANAWIEQNAHDNIRTALDAAGHEWAQLDISGQQVRLSGEPPSTEAGGEALSVAREATCPTWLGPKVCAVSVAGAFAAAGPAAAKAVTGSDDAAATEAAAACEARLASLLTEARIEFASGSAAIAASAGPLLDRIADVAKACPGTLRIEGHTDGTGSRDANLALSQARAEAVRDALASRGVAHDRLIPVGLGFDEPVASNATAEGKARNRRIELHVTGAGN